jgi:hypothetical protein
MSTNSKMSLALNTPSLMNFQLLGHICILSPTSNLVETTNKKPNEILHNASLCTQDADTHKPLKKTQNPCYTPPLKFIRAHLVASSLMAAAVIMATARCAMALVDCLKEAIYRHVTTTTKYASQKSRNWAARAPQHTTLVELLSQTKFIKKNQKKNHDPHLSIILNQDILRLNPDNC